MYVLAEAGHRGPAPVLKHVQVGPSLPLQGKESEQTRCEETAVSHGAEEQPIASGAAKKNQTRTSCWRNVKTAVTDC